MKGCCPQELITDGNFQLDEEIQHAIHGMCYVRNILYRESCEASPKDIHRSTYAQIVKGLCLVSSDICRDDTDPIP